MPSEWFLHPQHACSNTACAGRMLVKQRFSWPHRLSPARMVGVVRCAHSVKVELLHELYVLQSDDLALSCNTTSSHAHRPVLAAARSTGMLTLLWPRHAAGVNRCQKASDLQHAALGDGLAAQGVVLVAVHAPHPDAALVH